MVDNVSREERSRIMRLVPSRDTSAELYVRRALHRAGFRFRLQVARLPGKPDIVLPRFKAVIFVQGCLWHWHGCRRSRMPQANAEYWQRKIGRNISRDRTNQKTLQALGWNVSVLWECELKSSVPELVGRLDALRGPQTVSQMSGPGENESLPAAKVAEHPAQYQA